MLGNNLNYSDFDLCIFTFNLTLVFKKAGEILKIITYRSYQKVLTART
jgi:hypothetical protein